MIADLLRNYSDEELARDLLIVRGWLRDDTRVFQTSNKALEEAIESEQRRRREEEAA